MSRYYSAGALALATLFISASAYAHAHVESSVPSSGQVLDTAPSEVKITFSEALRPDESSIGVFQGKKQISSAAATASDDKETLTEPLPKLDPGSYTVKWKAVCLCTDHHVTTGHFTFSVR